MPAVPAVATASYRSRAPGRLNFTRNDEVPAFEPDLDIGAGLRWSAWTCLYLGIFVTLTIAGAGRRLRDWPA